MKITMNFFLCAFSCISFSLYPLAYDNAAYAAHNGKWKDAYEKLNTILVDAPDRADVLYDAGVAAYNLENFSQAAAYFSRAAECTDDRDLRVRSYFNAGNALVAHKDLKSALNHYEHVLALDPKHQYARHNYDRVKQMLEEQEKEQQQQQKDDQKDKQEQNDDNQDKQDNKNNDQQNKQNQSNNDKKNQQGNDQKQQSENDSSEDGSDQESKGEQGDNAQNGSKDTQGKDHGNKKEKDQKKSADNQKRNGDHKSQEKSHNKNNKSDTKQGDKHKESPEKQLNGSDNASVASESSQDQASSFAEESEVVQKSVEQKIQDPWLLAVLNNQEERDKAINKQLMEAKIHQHGGKNGQNCW